MQDDSFRFINALNQVTPEWLTYVLRRAGLLGAGRVVAMETNAGLNLVVSVTMRIKPVYSPDTAPTAPTALFLKVSKPDTSREFRSGANENEVAFYKHVAAAKTDLPVIRCHVAEFAPALGISCVLLDDLSATHAQPPQPLPPSQANCVRAVNCLARLHATWWENPRLGKDLGQMGDGESYLSPELRSQVGPFLNFLGDRLSPRRRVIYERFRDCTAARWSSPGTVNGLTFVHGDAHAWNFLYPRNPNRNGVRIFDWHRCCVDTGPRDLAHLIARSWFPERRALLEKALVNQYWEALRSHGVGNYSWDQCWLDYRKAVVRNLMVPVRSWAQGRKPSLWWAALERSIQAFEDLECEELLVR